MSSYQNQVNPFYIEPSRKQLYWEGDYWEGDEIALDDEEEILLSGKGHDDNDKSLRRGKRIQNAFKRKTGFGTVFWCCTMGGVLLLLAVLAGVQYYKKSVPPNEDTSSSNDEAKQPSLPYPDRVVFLGERHSGVDFYQSKFQECFPNQVPLDNVLTRETTWFQDEPAPSKNGEKWLFILVVRDPYTWVEAMRTHPPFRHMPDHQPVPIADSQRQPLDWKTFLEKPWTTTSSTNTDSTTPSSSNTDSNESEDQTTTTTTSPQTPESVPDTEPAPNTEAAQNNESEQNTEAAQNTEPATESAQNTEPAQNTEAAETTEPAQANSESEKSDAGGQDSESGGIENGAGGSDKEATINTEGSDSGKTDNGGGIRQLQSTCQLGFKSNQVVPCSVPEGKDSLDDNFPVYELDPISGEVFRSILDLRKAKIHHYTNTLVNWYKDRLMGPLVVFHYEHTLWISLERLAKEYKGSSWSTDAAEHCRNTNLRPPPLENDLEKDYVQYLTQHMDWAVEKPIGYEPRTP